MVYDSHSNSLLIYGGALLIDFKFVESSSLYSLDMHSMQWSMLHVTSSNFIVSKSMCMRIIIIFCVELN